MVVMSAHSVNILQATELLVKFMVCELCLNEAIILKNKTRWPARRSQFADLWNNSISSPILQLSKLIPEEEENQLLPKCNYMLNSGHFGMN